MKSACKHNFYVKSWMELTLTASIKAIILHWGRGSSSGDKRLETQQKSNKFKRHQPSPPPSFHVTMVPNLTSKLREKWESKMSAFSFLHFQSNYQIHLNLIIFQTLWWDLYIIRAICFSQTASFLTQSLWKNVSSLLHSLHASPVYLTNRFLERWIQNISDTLGCASCAIFLFLPHFDVLCDLLLNRRTATWNLFVLCTQELKKF